ncbi:MAG: inorganic pyrophosphatase [Anaerolineae bacterium]|nr:inorganic pyrophosphatase [Anaerolineae bacterium]
MEFWEAVDRLVASGAPVIDRPQGSAHPRYPDLIYPLDYGYLDGTTGGDGAGIDIWLGSGNLQQPTGVLCTVDLVKRDAEVKILLGCTPDEMEIIANFSGADRMGYVLVERPTYPNKD